MQESTSISNSNFKLIWAGAFLTLALMAFSSRALADDGFGTANVPNKSDEDDFSTTPYTDYGEFNEEDDEAADTQYLQYGRFFGVSLGVGTQGVTGNRGSLWDGGFPMLDFKLHYWFNFNFALDMGFTTAPHFFTFAGARTDVRFSRIGVDLKYYFDTRDSPSSITFAGPYLLAGVGNYTKTQTTITDNVSDNDSSVGMLVGAGLEFTVSPKKVYFYLQGTFEMVTFKDTNTDIYQPQIADMTGNFYSFSAGMLFTW